MAEEKTIYCNKGINIDDLTKIVDKQRGMIAGPITLMSDDMTLDGVPIRESIGSESIENEIILA